MHILSLNFQLALITAELELLESMKCNYKQTIATLKKNRAKLWAERHNAQNLLGRLDAQDGSSFPICR